MVEEKDREKTWFTSLKQSIREKGKRILCAASAPKWPQVAFFASLFTFSNMTWHLLLCLFSFNEEKLQRHRSWRISQDRLIYGQYCFFDDHCLMCCMLTQWTTKQRRLLQISPPPSLISSCCQDATPGPCPGQPSSTYESKTLEQQ